MQNRKRELKIIAIVIIIQTLIYIFCGIKKSYIHMDEAYSLGLASYNKIEIQDNADFYNTWHSKQYYEDYLTVNDNEVGKYCQVYENQKNDVHPPIYYLLLRFAMGFYKNHYSKWPGITVNIIIFAFITILIYQILQKLLQEFTNNKQENQEQETLQRIKEKSIILAFISSITMASLTNVIYIRMYALSTFNILLTTLLHIKLLENLNNNEKINPKLLISIGTSALIGSLTHYYFLFYLAMMYLIFATKYIKKKETKKLIWYTLTMGIAATISLAIFPYSIQHMFFGYRGQGVIDKFKDISMFLQNIFEYLKKINRFCFAELGGIILIIILIGAIYTSKKNLQIKTKNEIAHIIVIPTVFYFLLVAVASPWIELRYIMPICNLVFILCIYYFYKILNEIFKDKKANTILAITLIAIILAPAIFKIEPEVMYSDKKEIVEQLGNNLNVPTIYMFNSENNRFLDDILLFAELNQSYIAKDMLYTEENINNILKGKDLSNGLIVFINPEQENDKIIEIIKSATGLQNSEYLKRLNACDMYLVK